MPEQQQLQEPNAIAKACAQATAESVADALPLTTEQRLDNVEEKIRFILQEAFQLLADSVAEQASACQAMLKVLQELHPDRQMVKCQAEDGRVFYEFKKVADIIPEGQTSSENLFYVLKDFETLRLTPYKARKEEKHYTVGWGHYGADVDPTRTYTQEECEKLLATDLMKVEKAIRDQCHPSINQGQFDALVDLGFNCGTDIFADDGVVKDLDDAVRAGDWATVRVKIPQFRNVRDADGKLVPSLGLVRRRTADLALFDGLDGRTAVMRGRAVRSI